MALLSTIISLYLMRLLVSNRYKLINLLSQADLAGFEPAICSLGDCRPIRTRLQVHLVSHTVVLDIVFRICESLLLGWWLVINCEMCFNAGCFRGGNILEIFEADYLMINCFFGEDFAYSGEVPIS
jgi:hypothetical protein